MRIERQNTNHTASRADAERTFARSSASARHTARHEKTSPQPGAFEEKKTEQPEPEKTAAAPQSDVQEPAQPAAPQPEAPAACVEQEQEQDAEQTPETAPAPQPVEPVAPAEAGTLEVELDEGDEGQAEPPESPRTHGRHGKHQKHRKEKDSVFPSFQAFLDQVLSIHFLYEVFREKVRSLFCIGVVCTLVFMCVLTAFKSFTANTTMSLNYEESVTGKTPNGARFSESEFLTQEYLEAILQATGLQDDLTTTDLADCISVTPTTSKLVTKEDDYYISSSYNLSVKLPWSLWGKITAQDFLDEICRVYLNRFTADYRVNATSLDLSFDYSDMDYSEIGSYFQMMVNRINNYLTVRNDQAGSYLSTSGQSYSAVKKQVQNLQSYTLKEYQSYIWENGVAKNNARCIDDLNELNRSLRWSEMSDSQKSEIFMRILDDYNNKMVSSVLIPTYDDDGAFYMSRTKVGIDDLALRANELLTSSVDEQKSIATNNSKITALQQSTEPHEQQVAQAMVDAITQQLTDIVSATRELDADCYAQRITSYLVFSAPTTSFLQRYNVKKSVMAAALICMVWYLAAVVRESKTRQRRRLRAESDGQPIFDRVEEE